MKLYNLLALCMVGAFLWFLLFLFYKIVVWSLGL
jgi:hypothetical protein